MCTCTCLCVLPFPLIFYNLHFISSFTFRFLVYIQGMLGADLTGLPISSLKDVSLTNRLAIIAGTSTCHMAVSL